MSGRLWPQEEPHDEAMRQLDLRARNCALLAQTYHEAGFVPVIDDVIVGPRRLAIYTGSISARPLHVVALAPGVDAALERDRRRGFKRVAARWTHLDAEMRAKLRGEDVIWLDSSELSPEQTVDAILDQTGG